MERGHDIAAGYGTESTEGERQTLQFTALQGARGSTVHRGDRPVASGRIRPATPCPGWWPSRRLTRLCAGGAAGRRAARRQVRSGGRHGGRRDCSPDSDLRRGGSRFRIDASSYVEPLAVAGVRVEVTALHELRRGSPYTTGGHAMSGVMPSLCPCEYENR